MAKIRVRARTVDMLGRQQIAGLPTAISELFKNAHDAYARNVVVDYYVFDRLLVLRDDGIGMSQMEFEDKWLTIGTEEKLVESSSVKPPLVDPEQRTRPILGEKGIGRLSIASLGNQVLILSRAKRLKGKHRSRNIVAAYLHWDVFSLPIIDLGDVVIPVAEFDGKSLPGADDVRKLVRIARKNLVEIGKSLDKKDIAPILESMDEFEVDPVVCSSFLSESPSLLGKDGCGTHFFVQPADDILDDDITTDEEEASPLEKMLIGFTNTMTKKKRPTVVAEFRRHSVEGVIDELIGPSQFFTPEEANSADHHFEGKFDHYGQFAGQVSIYGKDPVAYASVWPNAERKKVKCGPFAISVSYVQGKQTQSRIPPDEHARIVAKLNKIGGLYIYRDGVRILPYGNSGYDFLNIEKRRTKGAGYYFFSYRRMFGAIELSRKDNGKLVEKAGREGFRENHAYREFRSILENFIIQLAADFFRDGGEHASAYDSAKSDLEESEKLRRKRERESKAKREQFSQQLEDFFHEVEKAAPQASAERLCKEIDEDIHACEKSKTKSKQEVGARIIQTARDGIKEIRAAFRIAKPKGIGLTKRLTQDYAVFREELDRLEKECFGPTEKRIESMLSKGLGFVSEANSPNEFIHSGFQSKAKDYSTQAKSLNSEVREQLVQLKLRAESMATASIHSLETVIGQVLEDVLQADLGELSTGKIERLQARWDSQLRDESQAQLESLEFLLSDINGTALPERVSPLRLTEAMEEELLELREQQSTQFELIQLGTAIGVIHHEFRGSIRSLREALRKLKRWGDANPKLGKLYQDLRTNFDHLDGYLTLFTPLARRLNRSRILVKGGEIETYLNDLFGIRFERHKIQLKVSGRFQQFELNEYPSSVYPCFVNLVDNACYWVKDLSGQRTIQLDIDDGDIVISDTGPGVRKQDRERIFELGFTRKPGGRGIGLYVCRETLKKIGYELTLDPYEKGSGATFRVSSKAID